MRLKKNYIVEIKMKHKIQVTKKNIYISITQKKYITDVDSIKKNLRVKRVQN